MIGFQLSEPVAACPTGAASVANSLDRNPRMAIQRKPNLAIGATSFRPTLVGRKHAVSSGHYLATLAAMRVLDRGGNAVDAGVTAAMALAVVQPDIVSFAGVAPTLIYLKEEDRVVSLAGLGWWPMSTDLDVLRKASTDGHVPEGVLRTVIPAAPATHIAALRRYGTISFEEAATPAMELARDGFPVFPLLANNLASSAQLYAQWPSSAEVYLPGGKPPKGRRCLRAARSRPHDPRHDRGGARRQRRSRQQAQGGARLLLPRAHRRHDRRLSCGERRLHDA
jgi:gamma-glutamyltranspeptidase/glutathione hydrolase